MLSNKADLEANDITFLPALNEDLGATAVWGSQLANANWEGRFDGVLGMWYGKAPGVDRSGDAHPPRQRVRRRSERRGPAGRR